MRQINNGTLTRIEQLQELLKSYYIFNSFDKKKAREILQAINKIRLALVVDADLRNIYYDQIPIRQNASGYQENYFFSRGDTQFTVSRAMASLTSTALISLLHQGLRQNVLTRESTQWQSLFSGLQNAALALNFPIDFEQELHFDSNQTLQIGVTGQTGANGYIFPQGCNLKEDNPPNLKDITEEIEATLPQWQVIPLQYIFTSAVVGTEATDIAGNTDIYSVKSDRSVLITHVSISDADCRISLFDDGRSMQMSDRVEALSIAGLFTNPYATYFALPYPHLLRRQDRIKMRAIQGSLVTGSTATINTTQTINFKGFAI